MRRKVVSVAAVVKDSPPPAYTPEPREPNPERPVTPEHRCALCWGMYGKSAIPCPNEPKGTK